MKSMFTMTGVVMNVFITPRGVSKQTGDEFGGDDKVQIMGDIPLDNNQSKKQLVELRTSDPKTFENLVGKSVTLPISFYAPSKGSVIYFLPKGHKVAQMA